MSRPYNFSAGPCALPVEILEQAKAEMTNFQGCGMDVMELSHRSKQFEGIIAKCEKDFRDVLHVPDNYKVLFMQGGASLQFACVPLNLLGTKTRADYVVTGQWSEKAAKEANKYCTPTTLFTGKDKKYTHIAAQSEWAATSADAAYVHYCSNETVQGVEFQSTPVFDPSSLLVADMSSNFMTREIEWSKHGLVYAGAQKNLGPAGVTMAIVRDDLLGSKELGVCPSMCSYKQLSDGKSLVNTPPCHAIYMMGLYLQYTKEKGGVQYWQDQVQQKAELVYGAIDGSDGFYTCPVEKSVRSRVNVPFQIKGGDEALEKAFLKEAEAQNLLTLAGHRSVGGIRASLYNGMPAEGVVALASFMKEFQSKSA